MVSVSPTRKDKVLDRIFTYFGWSQQESGTVPPLEVELGCPGTASDHRIAFVRADLPKLRSFEWITHQYRYYNNDSVSKFGEWLSAFDWAKMVQLGGGSNAKAEYYQCVITDALDCFFPLLKVRRKTSEQQGPVSH